MRSVQQRLPLAEPHPVCLIHIPERGRQVRSAVPVTAEKVVTHLVEQCPGRKVLHDRCQFPDQRHPAVLPLYGIDKLEERLRHHVTVLHLRVHQPAEIVTVELLLQNPGLAELRPAVLQHAADHVIGH